MLNSENPYKTLYCLYVFEHLLENDHEEEQEMEWKERFIAEEGYEKLFEIYTKLLSTHESMKEVEIEISQFILNLTAEFIVTVFRTENSVKSHEILRANLSFDDLIAYIASEELPTDKNKITRFVNILNADNKPFKFKDHEWKGVPTH